MKINTNTKWKSGANSLTLIMKPWGLYNLNQWIQYIAWHVTWDVKITLKFSFYCAAPYVAYFSRLSGLMRRSFWNFSYSATLKVQFQLNSHIRTTENELCLCQYLVLRPPICCSNSGNWNNFPQKLNCKHH